MGALLNTPGNYSNLICYKKTEIIYLITFFFCEHFLRKGDRTIDQMVQAARSGKQNIIEGCAASTTSSETDIKLINVAKASLKELLEDYEDFIKTRGFSKWEKGSKEYEYMRKLGAANASASVIMEIVKTRPPETIANMAIILLNQTDYLLHRLLENLEKRFLTEGGFREKMTRLRKKHRGDTF